MSVYPIEQLDDYADNGTMPGNVEYLRQRVVGHRIVSAEMGTAYVFDEVWGDTDATGLIITLDTGESVLLSDTSDCCARTELKSFLLNPDKVDHIITGVGTTDEYQTWHIYADMGDILSLTVEWSCGNPFYYGYGFEIHVVPIGGEIIPKKM